MAESLTISYQNKQIYSSDGRWLYPLFDMEEYLHAHQIPFGDVFLVDSICGIAGAGIIISLGIRTCRLKLISAGAAALLESHGVKFSYDNKVNKIDCRTEDLLNVKMDPEEIYSYIRKRAGLTGGLSLSCKDVIVSFSDNVVLNKLFLDVGPGETVIIKGDNGSGKTTLLKAIAGLIKTRQGTVLVDDKIVLPRNINKIPVAYVPQETGFNEFPVSVRDVISMALAAKKMNRKNVLYEVEIAAKRCRIYDLINNAYNSLSGGQKQRVQLARCICQKAGVILLDEPFTYLDAESKNDFLQVLDQLSKSFCPTIIIVTHDPEILAIKNMKVYELRNGVLC